MNTVVDEFYCGYLKEKEHTRKLNGFDNLKIDILNKAHLHCQNENV